MHVEARIVISDRCLPVTAHRGPDVAQEHAHVYPHAVVRVVDHTECASPISLQGIKRLAEAADALADELITNTYRTFMTRGLQGCYLSVCDPHLEAYLRRRIAGMQLQG